jgi:hypothetical protein
VGTSPSPQEELNHAKTAVDQQLAAGVLRANNVIELVPDESVVKLNIGDRIRLSQAQFERLSRRSSPSSNPSFCRSAAHQAPGVSVGTRVNLGDARS